MSHRWLPVLLAALLLPVSVAAQLPAPAPGVPAPKAPPAPLEPEISRLVQQLGDGQFVQREAAFQGLKLIGPVALPAIRQALNSPDAEVRSRAERLIAALEMRLDSERALTPTKVKLVYQDTPLEKVMQDLSSQTKYRFQFAPKDKALPSRRVTLNTEEIPFWVALDLLCREAKLSYELGGGSETLEYYSQENQLAKGRARSYSFPPSRGENVFVISDGTPPQASEVNRCGAVRLALRGTGNVAKETRKQTPGDSARLKQETLPGRPGAPVVPPPAGAGGGGMGGGGASGAEPMRSRDQRRRAAMDAEEPRSVRTYILEVQTEPKLQWRGPIQVRTEALTDDKQQEVDNVGSNLANRRNDPNNEPMQIIGVGPNGRQVIIQGVDLLPPDQSGRAPGKQDIALHCRLPENPGKVLPVLKGCLVGQVQTPREPVLEVPDVLKAGKDTFKGKDGLELQVLECTASTPRQHKITLDLHQPGAANAWGAGGQIPLNQLQGAGNRANRLGYAIPSTDFVVTDVKGREMRVRNPTEIPLVGKAGVTRRITFFLEGADDTAVPGKLVYAIPRITTIEVPFEFKNVPLQ